MFYATPSTDYDDGLRRFADLAVGQKVEVDFEYHNGKHCATEIDSKTDCLSPRAHACASVKTTCMA